MSVLKSIKIRNYRCFRKQTEFDLSSATYFIGANNSGKSATLNAIRHFFSKEPITKDDFNTTELRARQTGFNKSDISITFNLSSIKKESQRIRNLRKNNPKGLTIKKTFALRESTSEVETTYTINDEEFAPNQIPEDISWFLSRFSVSYIHPQDTDRLLAEAELKLRKRLINTFGRGAGLIKKMKNLEDSWISLRTEASRSLSENLTTALKMVWPDAYANVDLPEKIQDILAISSISFRQTSSQPEINLGKQGNGVQATVLFQAHYILDSDKTAHQGFHHPIWLVEEPETFLHADIALKLGSMLSSKEWLSSIQIIATTHSPLILATSSQNKESTTWTLMNSFNKLFTKDLTKITQEDLSEISKEIGDANFDIYFDTNQNTEQIVLEDSREQTEGALKRSGIQVTKRLNGTGDVKKYLEAITRLKLPIRRKITFILDQDDGISGLEKYLRKENLITNIDNFSLFRAADNCQIILLPKDHAIEDLFEEFDDHLGDCADILFDDDWEYATKGDVPGKFSRTHGQIRAKKCESRQEAKRLIAKTQDIKDDFWKMVEKRQLEISETSKAAILELLKN